MHLKVYNLKYKVEFTWKMKWWNYVHKLEGGLESAITQHQYANKYTNTILLNLEEYNTE
jgi:hypothetical protein